MLEKVDEFNVSMLEKADELNTREIIQTTILILEILNQRYQKLIVVSTVNVLLFYFYFLCLA